MRHSLQAGVGAFSLIDLFRKIYHNNTKIRVYNNIHNLYLFNNKLYQISNNIKKLICLKNKK